MRGALAILPLLLLAAVAQAADDAPADHVFVEVIGPADVSYVGAPMTVRLRVAFDAAHLEKYAAPLFRREMDVPVHVRAPWIRALSGAAAVEPEALRGEDDPSSLTFALNDDIVPGRLRDVVLRGGIKFTVLEVERRYRPEAAGNLTIAAPTLRFVHATHFEEDFVGGRTAVDPTDVVVTGRPLVVDVRPLPAEGRPAAFRDAVGRFTVASEVDRLAVDPDEVFRLTLMIEGEGNLATLEPPRLDDLEGFHVYGRLDDKGATRRTIVYELGPVLGGGRTEIPAIPFAFFDAGPPSGYRVVRTEPIPIDVRGPPVAEGESTGTGILWLWGVLLVAVGAGLMLAAFARRRRRAAAAPAVATGNAPDEVARIGAAANGLRTRLARPDDDLSAAFAEFLAAHLRRPAAAVVGPELRARLTEAGLPGALAERAAATLEDLVAARYGAAASEGTGPGIDDSFLDELDAAFSGPHARA